MCHDYLKMDEGDTDIVGWWLSNQRGPDKPEARPVAEENKGEWGEKQGEIALGVVNWKNRLGSADCEESSDPFLFGGG